MNCIPSAFSKNINRLMISDNMVTVYSSFSLLNLTLYDHVYACLRVINKWQQQVFHLTEAVKLLCPGIYREYCSKVAKATGRMSCTCNCMRSIGTWLYMEMQ